MDLPPYYALGLADLNGDGNAEIFARHNEPEQGYCDLATYACLTRVYVYAKNKKLVEIGTFLSGDPVIVLGTKTKNVNDLRIVEGNAVKIYKWNGQRYQTK